MNRILPVIVLVFLATLPGIPGVAFQIPEEASEREPVPDSILLMVQADYREGRFWHGAARFREAMDPEGPASAEELLLLAEGELGWGNWQAAVDLLAGPLSAGEVPGFRPWFLLGRALEGGEESVGAVEAYSQALARGGLGLSDSLEATEVEAYLRRALARARIGELQGALRDLRVVLSSDPAQGRWLALDLAREAANAGAPEATHAFLSSVAPLEVRQRGWDLPAKSLLVSGDSAGAEAAYWSAIPTLDSGRERADAWEKVAALRWARADSSGTRAAFHRVLMEDPRGDLAVGAASALLELGFDSATVARGGAEALARGGRHEEALMAYQAYEGLTEQPLPRDASLALARIHLSLREPRVALALLDSIARTEAPDVSPAVLVLQTRALGALGRSGESRRLQDSLVARYPNRPESVEILFLRADALQDRGDLQGAVEGFRATAELSPTQNLAGQARMRMGQIHLSQGRDEDAVEVFLSYLDTFPDGRRWDEAAFWAGRTLLSLEREPEGRELLERLQRRIPLSYYSVQAGILLGDRYDPEIPDAPPHGPLPGSIADGLVHIDALRRAGLEEGLDWEFARLADSIRALGDMERRRRLLLRLALEMNDRGLTREGINLGWEVRRLGGDWDTDLLSAVYPFPYREMVIREAAEKGLDPFLMAGLMRQESAFWHRARSRADARGLMQVLPSTGAQLARAQGPEGFEANEHLFIPEINLHLGMAFFSDMRRRFGEDLSILLSAYNAGPTRATRWRRYPEAGDLPRFVERIPFAETRGYVKNVLLNREIYAWLYGPSVP
jgi:soluble lytic murein transglycosylase